MSKTNLPKTIITDREAILKCTPGLYRICWRGDDNYSLACISLDYFGNRCISCSNWISMDHLEKHIDKIGYIIQIEVRGDN
jgi:hypothetical protein